MLRRTCFALRGLKPLQAQISSKVRVIPNEYKQFSSLCFKYIPKTHMVRPEISLICNKQILDVCSRMESVPVRTVTKFSIRKGKRKTVKPAIKRFFRLHWGGWIRTKVGRHKKLWKKSPPQKRRLRQHVFCNSTQSTLLDKMVTKFWKKPKYYVEDPYAPYHTREEFHITRKKPGNH